MSLRVRTPRENLLLKLLYVGVSCILRSLLFFWALWRHDVFIFGFGTSFFPNNLDLPLLKFFGKCVICNIAHGSDARPPYIDGFYNYGEGDRLLDFYWLSKITKKIRKKCNFIERYSDYVIGAPLSCHFLSSAFVNWFCLGVPYSEKMPISYHLPKKQSVRILHSPSHPQAKGTPRIREAIESLRQKGYEIEFIELIGQPNKIVLRELALCDFVIDQVYSDTPMAGFATESAWFGKPAVVGGYGWEVLNKHMACALPQSQRCHPDDLEGAIEQLVVDEMYRKELGEAARLFVQEIWSAQRVADRYICLIDDDVPEEWFINPRDVIYLHGYGLPEAKTKEIIRNFVFAKGVEALQLFDKPELERAFIQFMENE